MNQNRAKEAAGTTAAQLIQPGMLVGLGTGSTAHYFIQALSKRCREGLQITAVASSEASLTQARESGISIADIQAIRQVDITVDGADEIDPQKRMIKGGGGALLREKILASSSREMVVIIDSAKQVSQLGAFPLPVEISPFAYQATIHKMNALGYQGKIRLSKQNDFYKTDNGNFIYDIQLPLPCTPEKEEKALKALPGVVETGFFLGLAGRVIVGFPDGSVKIHS